MTAFLVRRFARAVPTVILISVAAFACLHLAPGGPVGVISGNPKVTETDLARIRENFGLDKPLPLQYLYWFRQVFLRFDFGKSYVTGRPVSEMILQRLPATLELMGAAFAIAVLLGVMIGTVAALKRGTLIDDVFSIISTVGMSVPVFWLGLMAITVFSLKLGLLPAGGRSELGAGKDVIGHLRHLVLPAAILSLAYLSVWSRYMRVGLLEAFRGDFIRTARAKGLGEGIVVFKHALRNAVLPVLTVVVMQVPTIFTGAVITETVFSWPGMGRMFYEGLQRHDYTRILGVVVIASLLIVLFNTIGDVLSMVIDPRISPHRFERGAGVCTRKTAAGAPV
ncbi:MAG: ABC transporter permease [bacterium]|nr:MAG: ABC transporter permease [bacterium]